MKTKLFFTLALIFFISNVMAQGWWTRMKQQSVPRALTSNGLILEKFTYEEPADGLPPSQKRMIRNTNKNLKTFNKKLSDAFKKYPYKFTLSDSVSSLDSNQYRFVFKHKLQFHTYTQTKSSSGSKRDTYWSYVYYFYDRKTQNTYTEMELYSSAIFVPLKKIGKKLSELKPEE